MGLLRILKRDPAARLLVLPASHDVRNEKPLMRSLRYAAAHTIVRPDDLFILGVEPEAHDLDFPGIWSVAMIAVAPSRWNSWLRARPRHRLMLFSSAACYGTPASWPDRRGHCCD